MDCEIYPTMKSIPFKSFYLVLDSVTPWIVKKWLTTQFLYAENVGQQQLLNISYVNFLAVTNS